LETPALSALPLEALAYFQPQHSCRRFLQTGGFANFVQN